MASIFVVKWKAKGQDKMTENKTDLEYLLGSIGHKVFKNQKESLLNRTKGLTHFGNSRSLVMSVYLVLQI